MGKHISEIEARPAREIAEWMALNNIDPFGEDRMDLRFALMTMHLISPHLKKGHTPRLKDFILTCLKETMTPDEIRKKLMGINPDGFRDK